MSASVTVGDSPDAAKPDTAAASGLDQVPQYS
jgi:hypothetical protein